MDALFNSYQSELINPKQLINPTVKCNVESLTVGY